MSILDPRLWVAVAALVLVAYLGGRWQQRHADDKAYDAERTKTALSAAQDQVRAVDAARLEEQRRTAAQSEIANDATQKLAAASRDADSARGAADRLRVQLSQYVAASRAASHPAATGASAPADDAPGVLGGMLEESVRRARIYAEYADAARIAGQACERAYDSLTDGAAK